MRQVRAGQSPAPGPEAQETADGRPVALGGLVGFLRYVLIIRYSLGMAERQRGRRRKDIYIDRKTDTYTVRKTDRQQGKICMQTNNIQEKKRWTSQQESPDVKRETGRREIRHNSQTEGEVVTVQQKQFS